MSPTSGQADHSHLHPERHDPDHPRQRHRGLGPPDAGHGPHPEGSGREDLVFTTLLSRSTTVSVDALLAAEPDAPDETAVVWTHTGPRAALTIGGADHSDLLK